MKFADMPHTPSNPSQGGTRKGTTYLETGIQAALARHWHPFTPRLTLKFRANGGVEGCMLYTKNAKIGTLLCKVTKRG